MPACPLAVAALLAPLAVAPPLPVVPDLQRGALYGEYYEVATYLQWMQIGCSNTTIQFGPPDAEAGGADADTVLLHCERGPFSQDVRGTAVPLRADEPARSRATFATALGADYVEEFHIVLAAPDFAWVVVGHPERHLLWILARTPRLPAATLRSILDTLEADCGYQEVRARLSCTRHRGVPPRLCRDALR